MMHGHKNIKITLSISFGGKEQPQIIEGAEYMMCNQSHLANKALKLLGWVFIIKYVLWNAMW